MLTRRSALASVPGVAAGGVLPWHPGAQAAQAPARPVRQVEHAWVKVRDGTRLAYRLWLPQDALASPVGVVLEAIPYGKRIGTRERDNEWADLFCPHGFAFVRLDLRGSGESEGLLRDEYLAQEQRDIVDVIAHLARQPWCNGAVGLRGYSWGGFAALQVAALDPPALKAIITACSSDDRYLGDAHYVGGVPCLSGVSWAALFHNVLAQAPDPALVGPRWRAMWQTRLQHASGVCARWLRHATDDAYWHQGSVARDPGAIRCGVYAVGGQVDAYAATVVRLMETLTAPRKGLIGTWGHGFPQGGNPGPALDWVVEEVRWWNHWLYGMDTGIMQEPMLHAYLAERTAGEVWPADTPGRWVAEAQWPSPRVHRQVWHLNAHGLDDRAGAEVALEIAPHQALGTARREWLPFNMAIDLPGDQSRDDALAQVFDGAPLAQDLETLGTGEAQLRIAADRAVAKVVVRINEVTPDGRSWPVTYGVLNLCQRDSHAAPSALQPHQRYDVTVALGYAAHRFKRGSRIRVAIAESLWPMLAPSPQPVRLTLMAGASRLALPIRPADGEPALGQLPPVLRDRQQPAPGDAPAPPGEAIVQSGPDAQGRVKIVRSGPPVAWPLADIGTLQTGRFEMTLTTDDDDPAGSVWRVTMGSGASRPGWRYRTEATTVVRMTPQAYVVTETLKAFEGRAQVFEATTQDCIPRRFF